jgi:hypothetical protein
MNHVGKIVIPLRYDRAGDFKGGIAARSKLDDEINREE